MPFHLLPLQKEDCEAFAIVDEAASRHWPLARAMEQGAASRRDMFAEWFHGTWGTDPGMKWMKVVDSETGEMVAGALWKFVLEPMPSPPDKGSKVEEIEGKGGPKQQAGDEDAIPPVFMEMGRRWKEFKDEFIGDQPFANLQVLVTHPKYQRRGAASMLIKYGCDFADEKGISCALTSSAAGYSVYSRHGFELKQTSEMDLRPYGVDATEVRRGMVRPTKGK